MNISEDNVVEELLNKNPIALEYIMDKYTKNIYSLASNILRNYNSVADIEECISDVFVEAWENISKYDKSKGTFKTWILILAKYKALDYRRKNIKEAEKESLQEEKILYDSSTEKNVIANENLKEILETVNNLGEIDRKVFYKRYFFYESIESIGKQMGLTQDAVYKRLYRSRKKVRELIEGWGYNG